MPLNLNTANPSRLPIIGLSGPYGAGKTTRLNLWSKSQLTEERV